MAKLLITEKMKSTNPSERSLTLKSDWGINTINSLDLLEMDFEPIPWLVDDFLGPGLSIIYGEPKIGKSLMVLQLAKAISSGETFLDKEVRKRKVLYLALEDYPRRLNQRMIDQLWKGNEIIIITEDEFKRIFSTLDLEGGKMFLEFFIENEFDVLIIDTFSRSTMKDQLKNEDMTMFLSPIQNFAGKKDKYIIFVDHPPKTGKSIFGSQAKTAIADTIWHLYEKEDGKGFCLDMEGRDLDQPYELKIKRNITRKTWEFVGYFDDPGITHQEDRILIALRENGPTNSLELSRLVNKDPGNTNKRIHKLESRGLIKQIHNDGKVLYEFIDQD